jgi:hypothetical protein
MFKNIGALLTALVALRANNPVTLQKEFKTNKL